MLGSDGIDKSVEGEMNYMLIHVWDTIDPDEVKAPKTTYEWVNPDNDTAKGEPTFDKVDTPGRWSNFYYHPVFSSGAQEFQQTYHCIPAVCQPVTTNQENVSILKHVGWNFSTKGGRRGNTRMG